MKNILNYANYGVAFSYTVMLEKITPLLVPIIVAVLVELGKLALAYIKHKKSKYIKK